MRALHRACAAPHATPHIDHTLWHTLHMRHAAGHRLGHARKRPHTRLHMRPHMTARCNAAPRQGIVSAILHGYMEVAAQRGFKSIHMHVPPPQVSPPPQPPPPTLVGWADNAPLSGVLVGYARGRRIPGHVPPYVCKLPHPGTCPPECMHAAASLNVPIPSIGDHPLHILGRPPGAAKACASRVSAA
jgi:hypothetical protein